MNEESSSSKLSANGAAKQGGSVAHARAMVALSFIVFTFGYLVISVFPYSGFMAIQLVEDANEENAGYYAGLISSSFMAGRALTSYHWGKAADVYGRKNVVIVSLFLSLIFSVLFGLSSSFALALVWRFCLGLSNGLMSTAKTVVAEIAKGDKEQETRDMGIMVGVWGWAFLACPAISGAIVKVTEQYPSLWVGLENTGFYRFLDTYPFFVANALGAALCLFSLCMVEVFIYETLPSNQVRHPKHMPGDILRSVTGGLFSSKSKAEATAEQHRQHRDETNILVSKRSESSRGYGSADGAVSSESGRLSSGDIQLPESIIEFAKNDLDDCIRTSIMSYDEQSTLLSAGNARNSLASTIARRSNVVVEEKRRKSRMSSIEISKSDETEPIQEATMASLWGQTNTRNHMVVYWIGSFIQVAMDEGFPLFLLSHKGGLALSAKAIGLVLSASGGIYVLLQYFAYTKLVELFGLYGSMKVGSILTSPLIALVPVALLLGDKGGIVQSVHIDGEDYKDLTWGAFIYLTVLTAIYRVFFMAYVSSLMVGLNRTVIPAHRGTMNGLTTLGGSASKAVGPSFAGILVAFCLSSGLFQSSIGAVVMFLVLAGFGALTAVATIILLQEEEELS